MPLLQKYKEEFRERREEHLTFYRGYTIKVDKWGIPYAVKGKNRRVISFYQTRAILSYLIEQYGKKCIPEKRDDG